MEEIYKSLLSIPQVKIVIILCIAIIIIYLLYGIKIIGWFGEYWTKKELKKLPKDKYIILNNIFLKSSNNTHQIDHIILSKYGIFSIETKQYHGYITGSKYDKKWIRHIGKKKIYYTNPIRQNYGHIKALCELLNLEENKIFNIVSIPSEVKLNIKDDGQTVTLNNLISKILSYDKEIIDDINKYYEIIKENNIVDNKLKKEHIKNIKTNIINNEINICSKCGNKLINEIGNMVILKDATITQNVNIQKNRT